MDYYYLNVEVGVFAILFRYVILRFDLESISFMQVYGLECIRLDTLMEEHTSGLE